MERRNFITQSLAAGVGLWLAPQISWAELISSDGLKITQAPLPYAYNALEPFIDAQTMEIHFSKHHAAYVKNLNEALELLNKQSIQTGNAPDILTQISILPESLKAKIRNNGGGHLNHTFFWQVLSPKKDQQPTGSLLNAINGTFGSLDVFKQKFSESAKGVFGSGWAWLIKDASGKLQITTTPNQDHPLMDISPLKGKPIIGLDVWEHAYYLKHQNKRADYIEAFWHIVNWEFAEKLFSEK